MPSQAEWAARAWPILIELAGGDDSIPYGELARKCGGTQPRQASHAARAIFAYCHVHSLPHLSALIVEERTGTPGSGFLKATDYSTVEEAVEAVRTYPWSTVETPSVSALADAKRRWRQIREYSRNRQRQEVIGHLEREFSAAANGSPTRAERVSKRIERNPWIIRVLKARHPWHCQVCRSKFFRKRGKDDAYSEVHHVHPLSSGGPDVIDNCIVVCPNCHRQLHYGEATLESDSESLEFRIEGKKICVSRNRLRNALDGD